MRAQREYARAPPAGTSGRDAARAVAAQPFEVQLRGRALRFLAHVAPADRHTDAPDGLSLADLGREAKIRRIDAPAGALRITNAAHDLDAPPPGAPPVHTVISLPQRYTRPIFDPAPPPPLDPLCFAAFVCEVLRVVRRRGGRGAVTLSVHCHHGCNRTGMLLVWLRMAAQGAWSAGDLRRAIADFGAARDAAGDGSALGIYDEDALWALHLFWFMCPPVRPVGAPRASPPWRRPPTEAAPAEFAEEVEFSAVPRPTKARFPSITGVGSFMSARALGRPQIFASLGAKSARVAQDNPLEALGCRAEWSEGMAANASVRTLLLRAAGGARGAMHSFDGCMPHELVDVGALRGDHVVSVKADGVRAQLAISAWGACLVLRTHDVIPVNVMRPAGCEEALLDGELMWPTAYGAPVQFQAFDVTRFVRAGARREDAVAGLPFRRRSAFLAELVDALDARVGKLAADTPADARAWSRHSPPAAVAQSFRIVYKPFYCLCFFPLFKAAADGAPLARGRTPAACSLCGRAPPGQDTLDAMRLPTFRDGVIFYRAHAVDMGASHTVLKAKPCDGQTVDLLVSSLPGSGALRQELASRGAKSGLVDVTAHVRMSGVEFERHVPKPGYRKVMEFALERVAGAGLGAADTLAAARAFFADGGAGGGGAMPLTVLAFKRVREDKTMPNSTEVFVNTMAAFLARVWDGPPPGAPGYEAGSPLAARVAELCAAAPAAVSFDLDSATEARLAGGAAAPACRFVNAPAGARATVRCVLQSVEPADPAAAAEAICDAIEVPGARGARACAA